MKTRPALRPHSPPGRQRGVAVITALLLTTLAITIVASLFWQQQVQVRSIENQRLQLQKQWILRGALDWAGLILREDAKHSNFDNLDEPWAVPLAETRLDQYVENGRAGDEVADATLSGGISDAQARYNLTNLCQNGTINPAEVAVFARLLGYAKLDPALAQATADLMAMTQKKPETAAANGGNPPGPQPMVLAQADDLLAVPDFTPQMLATLKDLVIFLPRATPVNVNTAPAEVLAARIDGLTFSDAVALVEKRNTASFRDLADFTRRLSELSPSASAGNVSVASNYFLVNGKVRMSRAGLEMQALIERNGTNTKLLRIREY
ncbi:MAG: type II secretion system minor pseudopilin GspK [Nitrosomonadales bacterium]|nr:type II secretion system minor pseudopilin GspK [Nitrosomonadales bacterium]